MAANVVSIRSDLDIIAARMAARDMARKMGFRAIDQARIAIATSELARNILVFAGEGCVTIKPLQSTEESKLYQGLELVFEDHGPGIKDFTRYLSDNYISSRSHGFGLAGSRRLMDKMEIETTLGFGTCITCYKWLS